MAQPWTEAATFIACVATILELDPDELPSPLAGDDPAAWGIHRWLNGRRLGLVPIANAREFTWPGPWIARVKSGGERRAVVMYGVPSGIVHDPARDLAEQRSGLPSLPERSCEAWSEAVSGEIEDGWLIAALDVATALPRAAAAPAATGAVEAIYVAAAAGDPAQHRSEARAIPDKGLDGDRHVTGDGTFPSFLPGSALTLIEAEVCESFDPPLTADEHRRNVVTRGIPLNDLVGHEFTIGEVRCRGMRLCEPCTVVDRYSPRPILRPLVHRGGLRADILEQGVIRVGDAVRAR